MHLHASQVAGSAAELDGDRLRYGGGNFGADILGGYLGSVGTASTGYYAPAADGGIVANGPLGGISQLTKVVLHVAAFWIVSIAILILLHKFGFRFSLTVG